MSTLRSRSLLVALFVFWAAAIGAQDPPPATAPGEGEGPSQSLAPVDPLVEPPDETLDEPSMAEVPIPVSEGATPELWDAEPQRGPREAFEQAISWAQEGVRQYRGGDTVAARKSLHDARIVLLAAQLPEALQERGLAVLDCALGTELGRVDLEAIAQELEARKVIDSGEAMAERDYIEHEARRILAAFGDTKPRAEDLETFVDEVQSYVDYYRDKERAFFERSFIRKHKYWPTIAAVFAAKKIPLEQGYMALVESGFAPLARSRANARGLWQFIPGTGRRYGLTHQDDFYDVVKSTEAAAEYLLDLIGIFGSDSFLLATAAYNAGEGKIMSCLRHLDDPFGGRSFWEIRDCLARETREYVPRIFAAAIIGSDPKRFGFDLPDQAEHMQDWDVVIVPQPTRLSSIAAEAELSLADLRAANSDLAPQSTRTPVRNFPLYVPNGFGEKTASAIANMKREPLPPEVRSAELPPASKAGSAGPRSTYRVRTGDTLGAIAGRQGVSVADLARWNGLRSPYRLKIGQTLTIHKAEKSPTKTAAGPRTNANKLTYIVRSGNSLEAIADLFSVQYRDLIDWNNLRSRAVKSGQALVIYPREPHRLRNHSVKKGETVAEIARRYGVQPENVLVANGLNPRSVIYPGATLRIYVPG